MIEAISFRRKAIQTAQLCTPEYVHYQSYWKIVDLWQAVLAL